MTPSLVLPAALRCGDRVLLKTPASGALMPGVVAERRKGRVLVRVTFPSGTLALLEARPGYVFRPVHQE